MDIFSGRRPGTCPVPNPIPQCASITGCWLDDMCALGEKCCLQSNCTQKCVKTDKALPPTPPPLPLDIKSEYKSEALLGVV